jgi:peptidoglycan/LPS O-acetylase OafA/YrhL
MKLKYRPEIDGLRAIAVFAVILYHAQITIFGHQPFKGGFIGVDIFFVISGYLITSIILKELLTTGSFSFRNFYERRIRRILPILLFIMLVSFPLAWFYLIPDHFKDYSKSILYSLGFSSNFYFYISGQQYGAIDGSLKPFLHTWSLSVEEQFYILFPITLLLTFKYFRKYLIHILILGFIISLGLAEWTSRNYPRFNFFILPTRAWELLIGSILAYYELTLGREIKNQFFYKIMPSIGLLCVGSSIVFISNETLHPSILTTLSVIGVSLIIWFSSKNEIITKLLSTKLFVGIGLISYSLYLWHYPIFAFAKSMDLTTSNHNKLDLILLTIFFSILSFFLIEKPARNKKIKFKKILIILINSIFILTLINFLVIFYDGVKLKSRVHPFLWKYDNERVNFIKNYNFNNYDHRENILIIGNSYADDLLNLFNYNKKLKKEYYFYSAFGNKLNHRYQVDCFYLFIKKNDISCRNNDYNLLKEQYKKSNYIIFHARRNWYYLSPWFPELIQLIQNDNKKFIILLDDISHADLLDTYLKSHNKQPNKDQLNELEKLFFDHAKIWDKEILTKVRKILKKNNYKFLSRSELYCDYTQKKCPLIINNNKIYVDDGHLTNNGAKFFSNQGEKVIKKLLN